VRQENLHLIKWKNISFLQMVLKTDFNMRKIFVYIFTLFLWSACGGGGNQTESVQQEESPSGTADSSTTQANSSVDDMMVQGKSVYNKFCLVCHQTDGSGVAGLYPPIINTDWVQGDKERLIELVLNGQEGPIEVNGETYNNVMPAQDFLKNDEVAAVLTYIRQNFENNASAVTAREVEQVRNSL